ncbi:hypothetical protein PoMZ_06592 [Pyricularia oryzae]|uniref:Uncharacterized protein n=1 Tax=Pyricularia oryzae TaxID=318829 RepID=A0A4P7NR41_PYROR|nr:hypothetical protein PoMZ_06592 [Pyricularia oryzae]
MSDLVYLPSSDGSQLGDLACALPKNATAVSSEEPVTTDMGSVLGLDGLFSTFLDAAWSFAVTHCITIAEKRTIGVGGRGHGSAGMGKKKPSRKLTVAVAAHQA